MLDLNSVVNVIIWYLLITAIGWLAFPIAYRMLRFLPERGYGISRILGLLLGSYLFWLLNSLGTLFNNAGGIIFSLALVGGISYWAWRDIDRDQFKSWMRNRRKVIISIEALFGFCFLLMVFIRAANPEIVGTEKPMELAFINAILNSESFPPHDPWLSGYGISYYYFGYIMVAYLAKISGVSGGLAFNLGISLIFALAAVGAYSLVFNLLRTRNGKISQRAGWYALLGPIFILIVSNLEGFLHSLHQRGLFWTRGAGGELSSPFWEWLDIIDLNVPPVEPFSWVPNGFWWWWRASRVLQDYNFQGSALEIIDEFPFFSFLLGDLHPHVLAIPFAFLVIALALNLFHSQVSGAPERIKHNQIKSTSEEIDKSIEFRLRIDWRDMILLGIAVGGMAFLNTWDVLVAIAIIAGAYAFSPLLDAGQKSTFRQFLIDFLLLSFVLILISLVLYFPFYLGFSSQAGGPLPNLIFPTRGAHFWVMFAPLLIPILMYIGYLWVKTGSFAKLKRGAGIAIALLLILWVGSFLLGLLIVNLPQIQGIEVGSFYLNFLGAPDSPSLFREAIERRFTQPGTWITLLGMLSAVFGLLLGIRYSSKQPFSNDNVDREYKLLKPDYFALLLIGLGILITLSVEFVYLRDQFGWRMNTIFKFYYQAWLLWGIAAAYGSAVLLMRLRKGWGLVTRIVLLLVICLGLVYPIFSLWSKTNGFQPADGWTLDGTAYLTRQSPEEMEAIQWLRMAQDGIVAEAVSPTGGSYQWPPGYARVSALTGKPGVLGWVGHESQWRGGGAEIGTRQQDLLTLYCSRDIELTRQILNQYNIRYVFVGELERTTYRANSEVCPTGLNESKLVQMLNMVFQNEQTLIYEVPGIPQ